MPYQGSAQSVGFRNRAVIDPSRRMRQEAVEIEQQGQQRIRGMEKQASQFTQEMQRVADIRSRNEQYELDALAKLSPTIQKGIESGIELYKKSEEEKAYNDYLNRPPATVAEDKEQVDSAIAKQNEVHDKLSKLAEKAPDRLTEDRVRRRSGFYQRTWNMLAFEEGVQGFGAHLIAELQNNTTRLVDDEGNEFVINDPKLTPEQRLQASQYIKNQWIKENNPAGLSAKVIKTQFGETFDRQIDYENNQYTQQYVRTQNNDALETEKSSLFMVLRNKESTVDQIHKAMEGWRSRAPRLYDNLKVKQGGNVAATESMRTMWETIATNNPEQARALIPAMTSFVVKGHPAGTGPDKSGTMEQLFAQKGFTKTQMESFVMSAESAKWDAYKKQQRQEASDQYDAIRKDWAANPPTSDEQRKAAEWALSQSNFELYDKLRTWEPQYKGIEESKAYVENYLANNPTGEIPRSVADKLHPTIQDANKDRIVERVFGSDSKQAIEDGQALIKASLDKVRGDIDGKKNATDDYLRARNTANKQLITMAKQLKDADPNLTETMAINQAADILTETIELGKDKPNSDYHYTTNSGFTRFTKGKGPNIALLRQQRIVEDVETELKTNPNVLTTKSFNFQPSELELNSRGRPSGVFYQLASLDKKRTAHEILNAQRRQSGLAEIPMPQEAVYVEGAFITSPALRRMMLGTPTPQIAHRAVEAAGGVTPIKMLRAIGIQESGGNYKAANRDPRTGNDRDPALGKYQMLWSNIVVWGPQYGLGHPGTQQDFLDNPRYQDQMAERVMGEYIRQAANASKGNVDETIRRAAAFWYGGTEGFPNWNNPGFSGGPGYPNMEQYTRSVLQHYKGGN